MAKLIVKPSIGAKRGKLTIAAYIPRRWPDSPDRLWCFCECGGETVFTAQRWRGSYNLHCGCEARKRRITHGFSKLREFQAWRAMIDRCTRKSHASFYNYGGRGITVDPSWLDFKIFLSDMGRRPAKGFSLDRIDVNKGYGKDNCRWAHWIDQGNNRRNNVRITGFGKTQTLTQWSRELNITPGKLRRRLREHPLEEAVKITRSSLLKKKPNLRAIQLTHQGSTQTIATWATKTGLSVAAIFARYQAKLKTSEILHPASRRDTLQKVLFRGEVKTVKEWCAELAIPYGRTVARLKRGDDISKAFAKGPRSKVISFEGRSQSLAEWCAELELNYSRVYARLRRGMSAEVAFRADDLRLCSDA